MTSSPHSYHPQSDSFEDRLSALREAISQLKAAQASQSLDDERLGTHEEKEFALANSLNTLNNAYKALSSEELNQVQSKQLLSQDELTEVITLARKNKLEATRKANNSTESSSKHQI